MKYILLNLNGEKLKHITIDESAKEDFKKMMKWNEETWESFTEKLTPSETKE